VIAISTVAEAMAYYLKDRHTADSEWRSRAHIVPALGETKIVHLTTDRIRDWHRAMAKEAPRLRTKQGEAQQHRKTANDDEAKRRRRSSANRTLTILKAALNHAWRDKKITSNDEWKRVKPFESVDAARVRYLSLAEARRLVNACEPDFRQLVQAALETGARYGKLTTLKVSDFNPDSGTVSVATTSGNKRGSHVVLTDEGRAFFKRVCAGRAGSEFMFRKATEVKDPNTGKSTIEYSAWGKSHQKRPMQEAVERAKITPAISFHGLRHTWASLAVMEGVPLLVVAKNLGHTDTRMVEKHYGHLAPSYIAEAIREKAPRYGFKPDRKIASLAG
jgi:integrase